mmetsp:Transcript_109750/g.190138  ORF Transcript_109750/g.190138 Transcript_109750/m.190138 type:complete len:86 (-) Transcript_109750:494-751(-)
MLSLFALKGSYTGTKWGSAGEKFDRISLAGKKVPSPPLHEPGPTTALRLNPVQAVGGSEFGPHVDGAKCLVRAMGTQATTVKPYF